MKARELLGILQRLSAEDLEREVDVQYSADKGKSRIIEARVYLPVTDE